MGLNARTEIVSTQKIRVLKKELDSDCFDFIDLRSFYFQLFDKRRKNKDNVNQYTLCTLLMIQQTNHICTRNKG